MAKRKRADEIESETYAPPQKLTHQERRRAEIANLHECGLNAALSALEAAIYDKGFEVRIDNLPLGSVTGTQPTRTGWNAIRVAAAKMFFELVKYHKVWCDRYIDVQASTEARMQRAFIDYDLFVGKV